MHENVSLHKVDASQIADLKAHLNHHGNAYHIQKSVTEKLCRLSKNMHGGLGSRGEAAVRRALSCTTWFIGQGKDVESFGLTPMTVILNDGHGCDDQAKLDVGSEADRRARVLKRLK